LTNGVRVSNVKSVGSDGKHLKLWVTPINNQQSTISNFSVIGFGFGEWAQKLHPGDLVDIVYNLEEDTWNGERYLQLKIRDLRIS